MMPPTLTSTNSNYDYDTVRPYFFLDGEEDDFYPPPCHQLLPGPGEDIWKKFELLQTSPLSPGCRSLLSDVPLSATNHLEAVSNLLDEDCGPSASFLQSFIIQDCMWSSGFAAATQLEEVVSEWLVSLRSAQDSVDGGAAEGRVGTGVPQELRMTAADCVDPSEVFKSNTSGGRSAVETTSEQRLDSDGADSESENEEDEIDVVTVNGQKASRQVDSAPLVLKRSHIFIHQHNYAARQSTVQSAVKRFGSEVDCRKQSCGCSPRSDSEHGDVRRHTHNVLERQRRSELKMSFSALRGQIPALADHSKVARVMILKEATEFIAKIREEERRLRTSKDKLRKRSRGLRRRLRQLGVLR